MLVLICVITKCKQNNVSINKQSIARKSVVIIKKNFALHEGLIDAYTFSMFISRLLFLSFPFDAPIFDDGLVYFV